MDKVYVVVREDLSLSQQAVQSGHALVELCINHDVKEWAKVHKTLVLLGAKNAEHLDYLFQKVRTSTKSIFTEPDLNDEVTAFAFLGCDPVSRKLKLLGVKNEK